jgi:hypothetical protein
MTGEDSTPQGREHAKQFFDLCDRDPVLRQAVSYANGSIIHIAATKSLSFNYADMQQHLRERWDVRGGSPPDFCCT